MATERVRGVLEGGLASVNGPAPDFELPALIGGVRKSFRLTEYRGKIVVLAFYPFNWQQSSMQQITAYQAQRARVLSREAETVAISVESIMNTTALERAHGPFDFPLCSDFWPHGEVCRRYGVLRESGDNAGASERAICIVDRVGRVVSQRVYGWDEVPPTEEMFSLLEKI